MNQYGIFNDDSENWTENESVEAGFYSAAEAEAAIQERYAPDDELIVHVVEEEEEEEEISMDDPAFIDGTPECDARIKAYEESDE
jgi:alkylated DNA repair dioxygenase AlkB